MRARGLRVADHLDFDRLVRALTNEVRAESGPHLDGDLLVSYRNEMLPQPEVERVQDHLSSCDACSKLLLDLDELEQMESSLLPSWRARLALKRMQQKGATTFWRRVAMASSTALLLLAVASAVLLVRSNRPVAKVKIVELEPVSERAPSVHAEVVVEPSARWVALVLHPGTVSSYREYTVEIRRSDELVRSIGGLEPNRYGSLVLGLPRRALAPGKYDLELLGRTDEGTVFLARFGLEWRAKR